MKKRFPKRSAKDVQQATLCFLVRSEEVLLAMKKRGFGVGFWNGVGGKVKGKETIRQAALREALEEIGIEIKKMEKVALLHFYFPDDPNKAGWNQDVHVFLVNKWNGEPKETEEMRPQWFTFTKISYRKMWSDDPLWLPKILFGERVEGWFSFNDESKVVGYKIKNVGKGGKASF